MLGRWHLLLAFASIVQSQTQVPLIFTKDRVVDDELYSFIQDELDVLNVAGASLAIIYADENRPVEYTAWGKRDEDGAPVTSDTLFNLGSCGKAFLSASIGILIKDFADGKNTTALPSAITRFGWDTKLSDLLPGEWLLEDEWATEKANLRDMLSHVTGLPAHDASYSPYASPADIVNNMRNLRTANELRAQYEYNNLMYVTGSYIVSKYSGLDYRDFVAERIFKPLGMSSSTLYPDDAAATGRLTQAWTPLGGRRIPFFMPEHSAPLIAGAGGVQSTVEDLTLWIRMLLNKGVNPRTNETIIPKATFELVTSAISIAYNTGDPLTSIMGYGMGWGRLSYRGQDLITHNGGAPGVATRIEFYPDHGFGVVTLTNTAVQPGSRMITRTVVDRVLGLPEYDHREPQPVRVQGKVDLLRQPFEDMAGTYANAGYGNFTLCSPIFSSSKACKAVVKDFLTVDTALHGPDHLPTLFVSLFAAWDRFWGTHLRLTPSKGEERDEYDLALTTLYTKGYGKNESPFEDPSSEHLTARFVVNEDGKVKGLGLFGAAVQGQTWRQKKGGSVEETADVWFHKIT
uniref:Beta-lactamase-related domain-containing protein n=1 Tax=Mycena chlorophos TaxID=658473 RepID=A0ABQ0LAD2_MYCCL|nr:predicted protein [Mycena chlorophos]